MKDKLKKIISVDKLIHEPARIAILAILSVVDEADFIYLMNETEMTQGNLSSHISKLENVAYINVEKKFIGKRPKTLLSITETGRKEFENYLKNFKAFLKLFK